MRSRVLSVFILFILASQSSFAKFEVHEWGTFTSLVGSNGITQHGLYHEDEKLPEFVHPFGTVLGDFFQVAPQNPPVFFPVPDPQCKSFKMCSEFIRGNTITQKMETPVLYFYSDIKRSATVNVRFPEGVITETFPAPIRTSPRAPLIPFAASTNPSAEPLLKLKNGNTTFQVDILPEFSGNIPQVDANNIYIHARNVASNLVRSGPELEKFIFYRGLGRFQPQLRITSTGSQLQIATPKGSEPLAAFLVHVDEKGHSQMIDLGQLNSVQVKTVGQKTISELKNHSGFPSADILDQTKSRQVMIQSLVRAGLYLDEATAMINTWENGYLKTPGLRLLYTLPRKEVEQILPMDIQPKPQVLNRVFIARIEVLLAQDEQRILNQIKREMETFDLNSLGRMAEPILHRINEIYLDSQKQQQQKPDPELVRVLGGLLEKSKEIQ